MAERIGTITRDTTETRIRLELNLDGQGSYAIETGSGFFDHMLTHVARHGLFDLSVTCAGDLHVDDHHTVEDVAICLGEALGKALGDKKGIVRFGSAVVPMEDTLAEVAIDLSGRPYCVFNAEFRNSKIGQFDTDLVSEFMRGFSSSARMNLHVNVPYGSNDHHIAEAIFKALGRSLRQAVSIDPRSGGRVPSTKGVL